jgi:hypothetical protein
MNHGLAAAEPRLGTGFILSQSQMGILESNEKILVVGLHLSNMTLNSENISFIHWGASGSLFMPSPLFDSQWLSSPAPVLFASHFTAGAAGFLLLS